MMDCDIKPANSFIIRNGSVKDLANLTHLNHKWQKSVVGENSKDGYLGAELSAATFLELIRKEQIIVAEVMNLVIGYYLLNNVSREGVIGLHLDIVKTLRANNIINPSLKIIVGAQAIVDKEFMGLGIRTRMLDALSKNVCSKFDLLFGTIAKDNPKAYAAHTKDGWIVVGEEPTLYYVVYQTGT